MKLGELSGWLDQIFSSFLMIDGYLFFQSGAISDEELIKKVRSHDSAERAQYWMNIVLLDGFITALCGDEWQSDDPLARSILSTVASVWSSHVRADFPGVEFTIHTAIDDDSGDFGLRLSSVLQ
jgi:hypothetical protein